MLWSREPAHRTKAMLPGILPSEGRNTRPYGPCGASNRSRCRGEMMFFDRAALYCGLSAGELSR